MKAWGDDDALADWRLALDAMRGLALETDLASPAFDYDGARGQIPRADLPYGTLRWQGSSGDRAVRAVTAGRPSPDYYKILMPRWAFQLAPAALTSDERAAVDLLDTP
jgi:hypothetical protein